MKNIVFTKVSTYHSENKVFALPHHLSPSPYISLSLCSPQIATGQEDTKNWRNWKQTRFLMWKPSPVLKVPLHTVAGYFGKRAIANSSPVFHFDRMKIYLLLTIYSPATDAQPPSGVRPNTLWRGGDTINIGLVICVRRAGRAFPSVSKRDT